ncbi:glycoside hydrolase [Favolaschia claudopus]|uniref:Glycoside hydrolase n=1 Tax=Favolaschia claudopus TaxID=2862362 RepID=A0AAW0CK14_9AGAR
MSKQKVLLLGATGHTGNSILQGLLRDKASFEVVALIRPSSADKPDVHKLKEEFGVKILLVDIINAPVEELVDALTGIDVFISAIDALGQLAQLRLVAAAKQAGVKRFVPCAWITVAPPGGIMKLRDLVSLSFRSPTDSNEYQYHHQKEQVYQEIWKAHLPYTIIDVGYWHQISFPSLPSGKVDYALSSLRPTAEIHHGGDTLNMLTDLRDIGNYVALIIKDERTLNRFVCTYSDALSENQIFEIMEEMSGEKIVERKAISASDILTMRDTASARIETDPPNWREHMMFISAEYNYSKYVRGDNTPEYAKYLGYLDARELYPEFKPISFRNFVTELLDGKIEKPHY